jgi:hypothetical protein
MHHDSARPCLLADLIHRDFLIFVLDNKVRVVNIPTCMVSLQATIITLQLGAPGRHARQVRRPGIKPRRTLLLQYRITIWNTLSVGGPRAPADARKRC